MLINPEFARLALNSETPLAYVLWLELRAETHRINGSSVFRRGQASRLSSVMSYSQRHMRRIIKRGEGIYWGLDNDKLYLRSSKRVARALEQHTDQRMNTSEKYQITIDIALIGMTSSEIKAHLYWSWFRAQDMATLSRDTLQDLFNLSHDQQRTYEKILGDKLKIYHNYAHIDAEFYRDNPQQLPEHHYNFRYERTTADGNRDAVDAIHYQLPNSYRAACGTTVSTRPAIACNSVRSAIGARRWHTLGYRPQRREYCDNWHQFEKCGDENSYVKCYSQGKKRLYLLGQYL